MCLQLWGRCMNAGQRCNCCVRYLLTNLLTALYWAACIFVGVKCHLHISFNKCILYIASSLIVWRSRTLTRVGRVWCQAYTYLTLRIITYSAIWLDCTHCMLQRNKSVYRLDSRNSARVRVLLPPLSAMEETLKLDRVGMDKRSWLTSQVSTFGGMEWWNGIVEWTGMMECFIGPT